MQINELPSLGRALQSGDQLAVDDANGVTYKVDAENINPTPTTISIPTGRWSGSGSDYYITVTASNVTADSILIPQYDVSSAALLKGPVWCVPAAGSFTIHTSAKPSGTVTILVLFPGTMGEAQYEVLADVYSKSQVDSIVAQSTASKANKFTVSDMAGTSSNMTIVRQKITRSDVLVVVQVVLRANSNISKNTEIMTLPYYHDATSYYPIYAYCQDNGKTHLLLLSGLKLTYFDETGLSSGQRLSFEYAYINT